MNVSTLLAQVDLGSLALPEFQRGYVWNRDQVRGLMDSLYRKHPVGGLLVWQTRTDDARVRGDRPTQPGGLVDLLLDGQQRVTSLYGVVRGRPPRFFDGNAAAFSGLYFNLGDETFEFHSPRKMDGNPLWVNVTALMQRGVGDFAAPLLAHPEHAANVATYLTRLSNVFQIQDIEFHIDRVAGDDKTVDVVVDIFNRVNSGGTKLGKGDLALAKVCAGWPEARDEMKALLAKWRAVGFSFRLEWLLRVVTVLAAGDARFESLANVSTAEFREALLRAERRIDTLLNLISSRLGLDSDDVLGSVYSFPVMARFLDDRGGALPSAEDQDKLLFWYIHAFLWGRYAGSVETVMNTDLQAIADRDQALDRLIAELQRSRGDLRIRPVDFVGWSRGSRFYPFLYMMSRVGRARDLDSGIELRNALLGKLSGLQLHHVFPKALLYRHGYARAEANAVANFTFLTQETNLLVTDRNPAEYFPGFEAKHPGVLASHWIPQDRELWKVENYREFLAARRTLLADVANTFLDGLYRGEGSSEPVAAPALERAAPIPAGGIASDDERLVLIAVNRWLSENGLPDGDLGYELLGESTNDPIAYLDLAWPNGLQSGFSAPVALLLDEPEEAVVAASSAGFRCFTDHEAFRDYVRSEVLALDPALV